MAALRPDDITGEPSAARLAAATARGDPDALAALYSRYARELLAVAYRLLQRREDAEDVVHDVFVGLPEALRRYEERGRLVAWLKTITARVALMRIRRQSTRRQVALDEECIAVVAGGPDDALTLERALRKLSPGLRAVLVLKEIEGFSHAEIAAMLGISVGASQVRMHRALQALRALITRGGQ